MGFFAQSLTKTGKSQKTPGKHLPAAQVTGCRLARDSFYQYFQSNWCVKAFTNLGMAPTPVTSDPIRDRHLFCISFFTSCKKSSFCGRWSKTGKRCVLLHTAHHCISNEDQLDTSWNCEMVKP